MLCVKIRKIHACTSKFALFMGKWETMLDIMHVFMIQRCFAINNRHKFTFRFSMLVRINIIGHKKHIYPELTRTILIHQFCLSEIL